MDEINFVFYGFYCWVKSKDTIKDANEGILLSIESSQRDD